MPATTTNLSLYAIPAAWAIAMTPHFYAAMRVANRGSKYDLANPRKGVKDLEEKLSPRDFQRYQRAEAAQQNGFESIGLFSSAVLAANYAKLPVKLINSASLFYLVSRVVYNFLYINTENPRFAGVRTMVFMSGIGSIFTLVIKAGAKLNAAL